MIALVRVAGAAVALSAERTIRSGRPRTRHPRGTPSCSLIELDTSATDEAHKQLSTTTMLPHPFITVTLENNQPRACQLSQHASYRTSTQCAGRFRMNMPMGTAELDSELNHLREENARLHAQTAFVIHELKQPLNRILMLAGQGSRKAASPEEKSRYDKVREAPT
jgi:signal transduction histidine kinase